jgi:hypothetical protein
MSFVNPSANVLAFRPGPRPASRRVRMYRFPVERARRGRHVGASGFLSKAVSAVSSVVGGVKDAFGKIAAPIAKLPGMKELAKALPKELGPVLKIMEYIPIPMTAAVALTIRIIRYVQKAAELRRDYEAAENFKRQMNVIQKQAAEQNVPIKEASPSEIFDAINRQRAKDVEELKNIRTRMATLAARQAAAATTDTRRKTFALSANSPRVKIDASREKVLVAELLEIDQAEAQIREVLSAPASELTAAGSAFSAAPTRGIPTWGKVAIGLALGFFLWKMVK